MSVLPKKHFITIKGSNKYHSIYILTMSQIENNVAWLMGEEEDRLGREMTYNEIYEFRRRIGVPGIILFL